MPVSAVGVALLGSRGHGVYKVLSRVVSVVGPSAGESHWFAEIRSSLAPMDLDSSVGGEGQRWWCHEKPAGQPITMVATALPANRPRLSHTGGLAQLFKKLSFRQKALC